MVSTAPYHPTDKLKLHLCSLRASISSADVRCFLQALDMGLVEEPAVGKPERIDRSWAIVHFQTSADKKAFIENHLEWFDNGYGKELVADGYEPLVKEVRPTQWIRNNGLGKMPVGECILFSENHEKKQRRRPAQCGRVGKNSTMVIGPHELVCGSVPCFATSHGLTRVTKIDGVHGHRNSS